MTRGATQHNSKQLFLEGWNLLLQKVSECFTPASLYPKNALETLFLVILYPFNGKNICNILRVNRFKYLQIWIFLPKPPIWNLPIQLTLFTALG